MKYAVHLYVFYKYSHFLGVTVRESGVDHLIAFDLI